VVRTLCAGDVETTFFSGGSIKVTKGAWRVPKWRAFVAIQVVLLGESDREAILLCECFNNVD
jgi:hypothetical protein